MALAKRHGVKVVVGTDCGGNTRALFGNHGIELLMLSQCGFTNMETIVAATGLAAEAMRLAEVTGSLKPGLAADVLIVDGNPWKTSPSSPPRFAHPDGDQGREDRPGKCLKSRKCAKMPEIEIRNHVHPRSSASHLVYCR